MCVPCRVVVMAIDLTGGDWDVSVLAYLECNLSAQSPYIRGGVVEESA